MGELGGPTVGGRYELLALLATGGMGQVWRARDTVLDRPVAVKVLRSEYTGNPTFLARFRAEARHTAALAHRNIAALHDYGEVPADDAAPEHVAYLVMELVEGEALCDVLAREPRLPVGRTLDLLQQAASGLAAAHAAGVVHRDVKPGNILVADDGTVKITDFGIAWSAASVPLTQTGQVVGTAHYLSPEQAAGGKAGPASDVYALGVIGYECLAGRRVFDGENSVQVALMQVRDTPDPLPEDVPENVRRLVDRALLKDPAARFADGAAFRDAVTDVLAGRMLPRPSAGSTRPLIAGEPVVLPWRRRAVRVLAPLAAVVAGAGIALAGSQLLDSPPPPAVEEAGSAPVVLVAEDFVGRPVGEVEAELGARGLAVERAVEETDAQEPGLVTGVSPTGAVRQGQTVIVSYAVAPPAPPDADPPVPEQGAGPATEVLAPGPGAGTAGGGEAVSGGGTAGEDATGTGDGRANGNAGGNGNGNGNAGGNGNGNAGGNGRGNGRNG
ncbi:protein kinase domain-containing protein [Blastococcus tunisiensis]|uniref:non-specific serine/threonine protein kinase n=1 Tax=Blastococcus tunisiensis TaxID=1798228 RepID=A0A1I2FHA1_9ACTN|nr:protein kinase [Blastococcus sp. DSM 46838]SFF04373.1 serine/threonine protein kinase [Blastococcus sp. DSM 46838]